MDSRKSLLLGNGMASLAALAAYTHGAAMGESFRIIQRPTAKRPPKTQREQGPRLNRQDKSFKLKGIRP